MVDHAAVAPGQRLLLVTSGNQLLHVAATTAVGVAAVPQGRRGVRVFLLFHPAVATFLVLGAELYLQISAVKSVACGKGVKKRRKKGELNINVALQTSKSSAWMPQS